MDELLKLIDFIRIKYDEISDNWLSDDRYLPLNMKKNQVHDIYKSEKLLLYVFNYRTFINEIITDVMENVQELVFVNEISSRVKTLNSIQDKIERYELKSESGKIPIKKCLNDIYGIRIVLIDKINYEDTIDFLKSKYDDLKFLSAVRGDGDYKAIHVYFGNNDNSRFQWELQIWNKCDQQSNLMSHAKHKQGYTKWEKENI